MTSVTITIPDHLLSQLKATDKPLEESVLAAIEQYVGSSAQPTFDLTQTETWQLCGSVDIADPSDREIVGYDEDGKVITNFAQQVDRVLY